MIIQSIEIENFRQFKGKQKIDFSTDEVKNVNVIMGENGAGKTTLEQAFTWCLYGVHTFPDAVLINRDIQNNLNLGGSVAVQATMVVDDDGKLYKIRRRQLFKHDKSQKIKPVPPDLFVSCQNENGDWIEAENHPQKLAWIEAILPQKLANFFFFDGERINDMSDDLLQKNRSVEFKDAVRALVGLNRLEATMNRFGPDRLKKTVAGYFSSQFSGDEAEKIDEYTNKIDELENKIKNAATQEDKYKIELENARKRLQGYEQQLQQLADSINSGKQYEQYKNSIKKEEMDKQKDEDACLKYFQKNSFYFLLLPLYAKALQEIKKADKDVGVPHIHAKTIEYLLDRGKCICGNELHNNPECIQTLHSLMMTLPPYSLSQLLGEFVREIKISTQQSNNVYEEFNSFVKRYMGHDENINAYHNDMDLLQDKLPNPDSIATIRTNKSQVETLIGNLEREIRTLNQSTGANRNEQQRLIRKKDSIISNTKRDIINKLYYDYAVAVYEKLKNDYESKENATRTELEKAINDIFTNIYDNEIGIKIMNDYSVETYLTGENAGMGDLNKSTAQSYAVIFAFIAGIIKLNTENKHKEKIEQGKEVKELTQQDGLPLVMDAPLSVFDKNRIQKICEELPKIASQIIIFIKDTDGDIAEEYMQDVIGKKWLIQPQSKINSTLVERS